MRWHHYAGVGSLPESFYAGGEGSVLGRKTKYNGEQQIYVDPGYEGRGMVPLGLDPFKVRDGVLSIVASRIPSDLKEVLFSNEYVSGVLTTQKSFSQKYGYFEIRAKIPLGTGVWPAFWPLANDGGWPPEIDAMEGRGQRPGDVTMTTHWRIPATGFVESCGFDFSVPNAWADFHDYGVLWEQDRLVYFIDRKPVLDIKVPAGFRRSDVYDYEFSDGREELRGRGLRRCQISCHGRISDRQGTVRTRSRCFTRTRAPQSGRSENLKAVDCWAICSDAPPTACSGCG
jgi:hypothetical protein